MIRELDWYHRWAQEAPQAELTALKETFQRLEDQILSYQDLGREASRTLAKKYSDFWDVGGARIEPMLNCSKVRRWR